MNEISDEVHVYFDVLVALMLNWVFGELDGTMIVAPKASQMFCWNPNFERICQSHKAS
jgi:hypothetical protein